MTRPKPDQFKSGDLVTCKKGTFTARGGVDFFTRKDEVFVVLMLHEDTSDVAVVLSSWGKTNVYVGNLSPMGLVPGLPLSPLVDPR